MRVPICGNFLDFQNDHLVPQFSLTATPSILDILDMSTLMHE